VRKKLLVVTVRFDLEQRSATYAPKVWLVRATLRSVRTDSYLLQFNSIACDEKQLLSTVGVEKIKVYVSRGVEQEE